MSKTERLFCQYSSGSADDSGIEALKLYLPVKGGYVNYNIVHSFMMRTNCNMWRLSVVYFCNESLEPVRPLTRGGAEWEMALKIKGRPDFIGGYAHGDEVFQKIAVKVDEEEINLDELTEITPFKEVTFEVWSTGYDPLDSVTESLLHYKKIICDAKGVRVEQRVEWLDDYALENSFMAMLPPFKCETDFYFTDKAPEKIPIPEKLNINGKGNLNTLSMCGNTGFTFSMKAERYLSDENGENLYFLSDNGGVPYNKMYFYLNHGGCAKKGETWETATEYAITKSET